MTFLTVYPVWGGLSGLRTGGVHVQSLFLRQDLAGWIQDGSVATGASRIELIGQSGLCSLILIRGGSSH